MFWNPHFDGARRNYALVGDDQYKIVFTQRGAWRELCQVALPGQVHFCRGTGRTAVSWAAKLPEGVPRLQEHLSFLRAPIEAVRQFLQQAQGYVSGESQSTAGAFQAPAIGAGLLLTLFSSTRALAAGFLETVLVLFFLLLSGDTLLRRLVEVLPRFGDKRQAIEISQHIEHDISAYLTIMNAAVGLATALAM